ncbi:MAG: hypothetical protein AB1589_11005 [Cyanobacteriota bacterium]
MTSSYTSLAGKCKLPNLTIWLSWFFLYATLFSNGLHSLGLAPIDEWRSIISRARKHSQFIGVNEQKYSKDLASATRHYTELKKLDQRSWQPSPRSASSSLV